MTTADMKGIAGNSVRQGGRQGGHAALDLFRQAKEAMLALGREVDLPKGYELRSNDIHLLVQGSMALCSIEPTGEIQELIYFEPGMLTNFIPMLASLLPLHNITMNRMVIRENFVQRARTDCHCVAVPSQVFSRELKTNPILRTILTLALTENLLNMFAMACNSPTMPASQRVCRLLVQFVTKTEPHVVQHAFTYAEIAAHLSLHAMTVAKIFKALKHQGAVQREGRKIVVTDMNKVREFADGSSTLSYL